MKKEVLKKLIKEEIRSMMISEDSVDDVDQAEESGKPKVLSVSKDVMSNYGFNGDYDDYLNASADEIFKSGKELSPEELNLYVMEWIGEDMSEYLKDDLENSTIDDIEEVLADRNIGRRDNTYNWNWWGPTIVFQLIGPAADGEAYAPAVVIASVHRGGDVRGNYGVAQAFYLDSYGEEAPWHDARLSIYIKTDQGEITLDAEDDEAYYFSVVEDDTDLFSQGDSLTSRAVENMLDFEDSDVSGIW